MATTDRLLVGGNIAFFYLQRKCKHDLRQMVDAILWLFRTGCQWRDLPLSWPLSWPYWQAVYYYFDQWKNKGTFEHSNACLNQLDRVNANREIYPSVLCIDSQSVKLSPMIDNYRSMDPHKRVNERKRTFVFDTQDRLWVTDVDAANQADGQLSNVNTLAGCGAVRKGFW